MKQILQTMLFLDEKTGKFSTSKFMVLLSFYLIIGINIKALKDDKEIKNASSLEQLFLITSGLYFGRRFNMKTKGIEVGGDKGDSNEASDA